MVFKRKVYNKLLEWKELSAGQSAVFLEGVRRIGKSTIVEKFAKKEYDNVYLIFDMDSGVKRDGHSVIPSFKDTDFLAVITFCTHLTAIL